MELCLHSPPASDFKDDNFATGSFTFSFIIIDIDIFVNCSWVDTWWE